MRCYGTSRPLADQLTAPYVRHRRIAVLFTGLVARTMPLGFAPHPLGTALNNPTTWAIMQALANLRMIRRQLKGLNAHQ